MHGILVGLLADYAIERPLRRQSRDGNARPRRVVAKVEWHPGELCPRVGFVVTNLSRSPKRVTKFYQGRGTVPENPEPD